MPQPGDFLRQFVPELVLRRSGQDEFVFIALFNTDLAGFEDEIRVADLFSVGASSHIEEGAHRIGPASFHCEGRVVDSRRVDDGLRASGIGDDVHVFSVGKRRVAARKGEFYGCRLAATRQNRGCGDDRKGLFHGFEGW